MTPEHIADFKNMVAYFWTEKGDPERFTGWNEAVCEQVWPEFLMAWRNYQAARSLLSIVARSHDDINHR